MTPGTLSTSLVINRGAKLQTRLVFMQETDGVETPIDLTGLGPFRCEFRERPTMPLLFSATVAETDLPNGILDISALPDDTINLPIKKIHWGLIDAEENLLLEDVAVVKPMTPSSIATPA